MERRWAALLWIERAGTRVSLPVDSDMPVRMALRNCHRAVDRIALAGPLGMTDPDTVGPDQDIGVDSDRAPDSGTGSADWDTHFDYSDRHWPAGPAEDIDSGERRNIPGSRLVDWGRQDCWKRVFLVALGSDTGYWEREHFRRIAAVGFDRDHRLVASSLERMDSPGKGDILLPSDTPDRDTLFVRKDWSVVEATPADFPCFFPTAVHIFLRCSSWHLQFLAIAPYLAHFPPL